MGPGWSGALTTWTPVVFGVVAAVLLAWVVLVVALWWVRPDRTRWWDAVRLAPDIVRLLRRLAADPELPRGVRVRLGLLLVYLLSPIDLIPDVVPVLGYADDAIVVVLALRSVIRRAGPPALERHWQGTPDGLATVHRLAGRPRDGDLPRPGTANR